MPIKAHFMRCCRVLPPGKFSGMIPEPLPIMMVAEPFLPHDAMHKHGRHVVFAHLSVSHIRGLCGNK